MKIVKVELNFKNAGTFLVTYEPNFFEKLVGIKKKTVIYKETNQHYKNGWTKYTRENGSKPFNAKKVAKAIDLWRIGH